MEKFLNTGPSSSKPWKVHLKPTAKLTQDRKHLEVTYPTSSGKSVKSHAHLEVLFLPQNYQILFLRSSLTAVKNWEGGAQLLIAGKAESTEWAVGTEITPLALWELYGTCFKKIEVHFFFGWVFCLFSLLRDWDGEKNSWGKKWYHPHVITCGVITCNDYN